MLARESVNRESQCVKEGGERKCVTHLIMCDMTYSSTCVTLIIHSYV